MKDPLSFLRQMLNPQPDAGDESLAQRSGDIPTLTRVAAVAPAQATDAEETERLVDELVSAYLPRIEAALRTRLRERLQSGAVPRAHATRPVPETEESG